MGSIYVVFQLRYTKICSFKLRDTVTRHTKLRIKNLSRGNEASDINCNDKQMEDNMSNIVLTPAFVNLMKADGKADTASKKSAVRLSTMQWRLVWISPRTPCHQSRLMRHSISLHCASRPRQEHCSSLARQNRTAKLPLTGMALGSTHKAVPRIGTSGTASASAS